MVYIKQIIHVGILKESIVFCNLTSDLTYISVSTGPICGLNSVKVNLLR